MSYKQINAEERDKIAILKAKGYSAREIGKMLGRHHSTIANELNRNKIMGRYLPHKAQEKAEMRLKQNHKHKRLKTYAIRIAVEEMLLKNWSPELIAGRLKLLHGKQVISHEVIYQWIYNEKPYLIGYLVRSHKERKKRHTCKNKRSIRIPDRVSI